MSLPQAGARASWPPVTRMTMRQIGLLAALASLCSGCGGPGLGEAIASLIPASDLTVAPTAALPAWGTLDTGALTQRVTIVGTVADQDGAGMAGVVLCYGPSEAEAVAIGVTDAAGAYLAKPPQSLSGTSGNLMWAYLPLYRFEPDPVTVGMLMGETTLDFTAYPSVYPVPPERDCR